MQKIFRKTDPSRENEALRFSLIFDWHGDEFKNGWKDSKPGKSSKQPRLVM
jgi:hypothetical protein